MELVWTELAITDRLWIMDYIARDNPIAAAELDIRFEQAAELALSHPEMYKPGRVIGTHEAVVHPHYILVYRVTATTLEVLRILYAAHQWPQH